MPQLLGWLFQHAQLGVCKILRQSGSQIGVEFVGGDRKIFSLTSVQDRILERVKLAPGLRCKTDGGECRIRKATSQNLNQVVLYEVEFVDSGRSDVLPETVLTPLAEQVVTNPAARLAIGQHQEYGVFRAREQLLAAHSKMLRQAGGLSALLSSRVDLRPHQAYVGGVVLQDPRRRYILADEVGLGKTIEAGIVIHDLLRQNPKAHVLILCPGSLATQWLSELYSKFGGYIFKMLDLATAPPRASELRLAIASTAKAATDLGEVLGQVRWDMVVVDEAHHLLDWPSLYRAVSSLATKAPSLLLLSAVPARRREDEYLKLLQLLEPQLYARPHVQERFGQLYAAQKKIGAGLRVLSRRVEEFESGSATEEEVRSDCLKVLRLPVVSDDARLASVMDDRAPVAEQARRVLHEVADRYRIHRRILRNRRALLVEQGRLAAIERVFVPVPYEPDPREQAALDAAHGLVTAARRRGLEDAILLPFTRVLLQSTCDADALADFVEELDTVTPQRLTEKGRDYIGHGHLVGQAGWEDYVFLLCLGAKQAIAPDAVARAVNAAAAWKRAPAAPARRTALLEYLRHRRTRGGRPAKMLVFAGYPSIASGLAEALGSSLGEGSVAQFRSDMEQLEKEQAVLQFRDDPRTWVLVSDESGGEGRNFQFASELVHYDTPWHNARIEQRIGRLDRMGREEFDAKVESIVLYARGSPEEGYVDCAAKAVGVYTRSLSGLEFGLRDVEDTIARAATADEPLESMHEIQEDLRQRADDERARDDGDALLDEASYERRTAERYLRLSRDPQAEPELEKAFVEFFQALGSRSVSRSQDESGQPMLRFDTHRLPPNAIALPEQASGGDGLFKGTFNRSIAQGAPGMQFFQVGNPLFDAVLESAKSMPVGRSYAVECTCPGVEAWRGFEFVFKAAARPGLLDDQPALALRASAVLDTASVQVFVDGVGELGPAGLREVRAGLLATRKNVSWFDLAGTRVAALTGAFRRPWAEVLAAAGEVAVAAAKRALTLKVQDALDQELKFLAELERGIDPAADPDAAHRREQFRRYRDAIEGWDVAVDSAGFLSVNAPLR
jgi:ATP-dependent helicase HepA